MKQKVCLITGGAGFLGEKYCMLFSKKNFKVLCVDNNLKKLKKIANLKLKNVITYKCDITSDFQVKKLFKLINRNMFVDVLLNNAAIDAVPSKLKNKFQKFPSMKMWDTEMDVSLKGSFLMIKYFGEQMSKKKGGSIINIGSDLSIIAPNQKIYRKSYSNYIKPITYSIIKHGMLGLTRYFASLYGKDNVRVNMVSPGPIKNNQKKDLIRELKNIIPMNRLGNYNDLFGILIFLANDESSYITGQNIIIDGGRTII